MKLIIYFIPIFIYINSFAAELPPKWRFEYNYGQVTTHYLEEQPSIVFTSANVKQVADFHQFIYQYYIFPPWMDFSIGGNVTGYQVQEPEDPDEQFKYLTLFTNLGVVIPISDYWHTKIIFEYFYTSMVVPDDEFGFRNLKGFQIYPELEWLPYGSSTFLQISPYFKFPLYSDIGSRKETTIGVKISLPLGAHNEQRFPSFAYQNALTLRVFYTNMTLDFEKEGFISSEISVRQVGASVGFNF